ncbi:MAG: ABC-three component system protein [Pedobacter sp.]
MTPEEFLKASTCRIECDGVKGSGFFISPKTILTCYHVVVNVDDQNPIELFDYLSNPIAVELIKQDIDCDIAILNIVNGYKSECFLQLCESEIVPDVSWISFGYPTTQNGRLVGEPLSGTIRDFIVDSSLTIHDSITSVSSVNALTAHYDGFSGSPLVDQNNNVISILRYQAPNYLNSVSIKKASAFLKNHFINIKPDELCSFSEYLPFVFDGFESDPKLMCNKFAAEVSSTSSPNVIINSLLGSVFFPNRAQTSKELIAELKRNKEQSNAIWIGWLEFLSHVSLLKGEHSNANEITITLSSTSMFKMLRINVGGTKAVKLKLRFLWTDSETYLEVAKQYIHKEHNTEIENNTCHIFNSKKANFGGIPLTANFKKNIIQNISSPNDSGFRIRGTVDFGILSLQHLNNEVKKCVSITLATENLEKLFRDAIQES